MKQLTPDSGDRIRALFAKYPPAISEFTFSNLMMWRHSRPLFLEEIEGTSVFIVEENGERVLFGGPLGPAPLHEILNKLPVTKAIRCPYPARPIPNWRFSSSPADADYVYKVSDLLHYPGRRYRRKRQLMRGCLRRAACQWIPITETLIPECLAFQEKLVEMTQPDGGQLEEYEASATLLKEWTHFNAFGGAIKIEGRIEAMMAASRLNSTTAVGHIEKINPHIHGLSSLLFHWFAKEMLQDFSDYNVEQDLGLAGLRTAKSRFKPDHMVVKCSGKKLDT